MLPTIEHVTRRLDVPLLMMVMITDSARANPTVFISKSPHEVHELQSFN